MSHRAGADPVRTGRSSPAVARRTVLGMAALLGLGAPALAGCSGLLGIPGVPGLTSSGDGGTAELLDRIDPSGTADASWRHFIATRPQAIAEAFDLQVSEPLGPEQLAQARLPSSLFLGI